MATLSNITGFKGGTVSDTRTLGCLNSVAYHLRYQLDIGTDESGTQLAFQIGGASDAASIYWINDGGTLQDFDDRLKDSLKFCCAISEDENEYADLSGAPIDYQLNVEKKSGGGDSYIVKCDGVDYNLYPGKTYYLWIYPADTSSWGRLGWTSGLEETLTLNGTVEFPVNYDAGDGAGAPETQIKTFGEDLVLSGTVPTKKGHSFLGWATAADGEVAYQPGDTYSEDAAVTLYAVWQANQYTDTFDPNGGAGGGSFTGDYGTSYPAPTAQREQYAFAGWWTQPEGGEKFANSGQTITHNDVDDTVYAQWSRTWHIITCNPNGGVFQGSGDITEITVLPESNIGANIGQALKAPTSECRTVTLDANGGGCIVLNLVSERQTGYSFTGWYDQQGTQVYDREGQCVESQYWQDGLWAYEGDLEIHARHTDQPGEFEAVQLPAAARAGYRFCGWAEHPQAFEGSQGDYVPQGDVTLYAIWEEASELPLERYRILLHTRGRDRAFRVLVKSGSAVNNCALYLETRSTSLTATHDGAGTVTLHGDISVVYDGNGTVRLVGAVVAKYEDGTVTIKGGIR